MRAGHIVALITAVALAQPPLMAQARVMTVMMCGGETLHMIMPGHPDDPSQRRDCAKACHAIAERRTKPGDPQPDCC